MSEAAAPPSSTAQGAWRAVQPALPVLAGILLVEAALGLLSPLIGIQLARWNISSFLIGIVASAYSVGFLVGTLMTPRIIDRVGHIRAFSVFVVIAADATILHLVIGDAYAWAGLRAACGFALAGAFVVIESWLNDKSTEANRSRIFAVYTAVSWGASGVSPLLLNVEFGGEVNVPLFALSALMIASAMIPLGLTRIGNPEIGERAHFGILRLFLISPLGFVCCFGSGALNGALYGLLPAYIAGAGMGEAELSLLISIGTIAALGAQFPIGAIADRRGRRPVIIAVTLISALAATAIFAWPHLGYSGLVALFFLLTATASPLYGLGVGQTNDYIEKSDFVAAASGLLFAWGLGAALGPAGTGLVMAAFGNGHLFLVLALSYAAIALYALYRVFRRKAKTPAEQGNYVPPPMPSASQGAAELDPRGEYHHHRSAPSPLDRTD